MAILYKNEYEINMITYKAYNIMITIKLKLLSNVPEYIHDNYHSASPTEHPYPFGSLLQLI